MRYKIRVYSIWEFGQRVDSEGNPHQEDSMFPEFGKATDNDRLFILCDGMGGHDAGEVASQTVCEAMGNSILTARPDAGGEFSADDISNAVNDAFDALDLKDNGAEKKMGTTMTMLKLHSRGYSAAHIGDSRIYQIRPGKKRADTVIMFKTEDHSLVNVLLKSGELTPEEAKTFKQKNVITRAMQPTMERRCKADIHESADIQAGDYFYLCSDGMLEHTDDDNLRWIFSDEGGNDEKKVEILKKTTAENRDNHTAFIIHILEVVDPIIVPTQPAPPADKDAVTRKKKKQIIGILIAVIVAVGVIAATLFLLKPKPIEQKASEEEHQPAEETIKQEKTNPQKEDSTVTLHPMEESVTEEETSDSSGRRLTEEKVSRIKKAIAEKDRKEGDSVVESDNNKIERAIKNK